MACEKYSGSITDAALGALQPDREMELRAHVALCDNCREEWRTAIRLAAAVNGAVESLVAGEPSPQFAARLRARIAEEPASVAWPILTWPRISSAALVAAVALFVVLTMRSPERVRPSARTVANTPGAVVQPRSAAVQPAFERIPAPPRIASRQAPARVQVDAASISFEVLVPRGQLSAALLLGEAASDGRIDGAQLSAFAEETARPLEVKAIEIVPLEAPRADGSAIADSPAGPRRD